MVRKANSINFVVELSRWLAYLNHSCARRWGCTVTLLILCFWSIVSCHSVQNCTICPRDFPEFSQYYFIYCSCCWWGKLVYNLHCVFSSACISGAEPSDAGLLVIALCSALPALLYEKQQKYNFLYCSERLTVWCSKALSSCGSLYFSLNFF